MSTYDDGSGRESQPGGTTFFTWVRSTGIRRSDDRWFAGVCAGLAERTGLDPLLVRGIAVVVAILGGPAFLFYAAAWLLLPDSDRRIHLEQLIRGVFDPAIIAIGLLVIFSFVPVSYGLWWRGAPGWWGMPGWLETMFRTAWAVVVIGALIWGVVYVARRVQAQRQQSSQRSQNAGASEPRDAHRESADSHSEAFAANTTDTTQTLASPPSATSGGADGSAQSPRPPSQSSWHQPQASQEASRRRAEHRARQPSAAYVALSLGLALIGGAMAAGGARLAGLSHNTLLFGLAGALAVLALSTIVAGIRGRENGLLGLFSTIAVIGLIFTSAAPPGTHVSAFGDAEWSASGASGQPADRYLAAFGSPTLDLRSLGDDAAGASTDVWVTMGNLDVLVPDDVPVRIDVSGFASNVDSFGDVDSDGTESGLFPSAVLENSAAATSSHADVTTIDVHMLFGNTDITVEEAADDTP